MRSYLRPARRARRPTNRRARSAVVNGRGIPLAFSRESGDTIPLGRHMHHEEDRRRAREIRRASPAEGRADPSATSRGRRRLPHDVRRRDRRVLGDAMDQRGYVVDRERVPTDALDGGAVARCGPPRAGGPEHFSNDDLVDSARAVFETARTVLARDGATTIFDGIRAESAGDLLDQADALLRGALPHRSRGPRGRRVRDDLAGRLRSSRNHTGRRWVDLEVRRRDRPRAKEGARDPLRDRWEARYVLGAGSVTMRPTSPRSSRQAARPTRCA